MQYNPRLITSFSNLADEVRSIFGTDLCMVNLNLSDVQYFRAWSGELPAELAEARQDALEHSMCQYVVNSEMPLVVKDFLATEEFQGATLVRELRHPLLRGDTVDHLR